MPYNISVNVHLLRDHFRMDRLKQLIYKILNPLFKLYCRVIKPETQGSRAIVLHENNTLLVKNIGLNYWSLPGGKIDRGETPEACLFRELGEELSISVSNVRFKLGEYFSTREGNRDTIHIYVVDLTSPTFRKQWELDDARWFPLSALPESISPATSRRIQEFLSDAKDVRARW